MKKMLMFSQMGGVLCLQGCALSAITVVCLGATTLTKAAAWPELHGNAIAAVFWVLHGLFSWGTVRWGQRYARHAATRYQLQLGNTLRLFATTGAMLLAIMLLVLNGLRSLLDEKLLWRLLDPYALGWWTPTLVLVVIAGVWLFTLVSYETQLRENEATLHQRIENIGRDPE